MKRTNKRIICLLLALAMIFGVICAAPAASALGRLQNVSFIGGVLKWSAFPGAGVYYFSYGEGGIPVTSPFDVKGYFELKNFEAGTYNISLYAFDKPVNQGGKQISEGWFGTYKYGISSLQNVKISSDGILSWDSFAGAKAYILSSGKHVSSESGSPVDLKKWFSEGSFESGTYNINLYAVDNYLYAGGKPISAVWTGTYTYTAMSPIQNVKISSSGIMTWDEYPGAAYYYFNDGIDGTYAPGTYLDLNEYFSFRNKASGTYNISLYAIDKAFAFGGKQISSTWTGTYTYKTPYMLGDVDKNGKVTTADALAALKMAVGIINPTSEQKTAADVDKDGKVTTADALAILKFAVGIIKSF